MGKQGLEEHQRLEGHAKDIETAMAGNNRTQGKAHSKNGATGYRATPPSPSPPPSRNRQLSPLPNGPPAGVDNHPPPISSFSSKSQMDTTSFCCQSF